MCDRRRVLRSIDADDQLTLFRCCCYNPRRRTPDPSAAVVVAADRSTTVVAADRSTTVVAVAAVERIDPECCC